SAAKNADVLFLGNSRVMFALGQDELKPFFKRLGLSYYVMAFPYGEPSSFPQAIIRKYDLRPKWLVVNADPFFVKRTSPFARMVMAEDWWNAWKFKLEMDLGFLVRSRLHQIVPCYDMTCPEEADWITFGSYRDGTTRVAVARGKAGGFKKVPGRENTATKPQLLVAARRFKKDMDRRGVRMVLTTLPPHSPKMATTLGAALGVPVVLPDVKNLTTYDGGHLDRQSAARYASAFLAELEKVIAREDLAKP
ncbi:MAG TPA: hypothetical protein VHP11_02170, partial [Tepidisphaeraceae bacterium]|nr:hypothetical protein [Tepidisphaeraceae bacterium]